MERSIFGSTCSLGGLLNDLPFSEGEADQFLQDLGAPASRSQDLFPPLDAGSAALSLESALPGEAGFLKIEPSSLPLTSCPPSSAPDIASGTAAVPAQDWQATSNSQPTLSANTRNLQSSTAVGDLALLSQLLGAIQANAVDHPPTLQSQPQHNPDSLLRQCAAAFKPAITPLQQFAPVSQAGPGTGPAATLPLAPTQTPTLPNMNAQQQQALQAIMAIGQFGSTIAGKKVRRMLSNRESARRSRHRKQAHVQELEERATRLEAENISMKEALAHASQQELQAVEDRTRLYSEIADLRQKLAEMNGVAQSKNKGKVDVNQGNSHASTAGGTSEDSCDSIPAKSAIFKVRQDEACCKRCRTMKTPRA